MPAASRGHTFSTKWVRNFYRILHCIDWCQPFPFLMKIPLIFRNRRKGRVRKIGFTGHASSYTGFDYWLAFFTAENHSTDTCYWVYTIADISVRRWRLSSPKISLLPISLMLNRPLLRSAMASSSVHYATYGFYASQPTCFLDGRRFLQARSLYLPPH